MKPIPAPGTPAPAFDVADARGERLRLADLRGQPVVLAFLRHLGCPICKMELATFKRRSSEFTGRGAALVVFVDADDASVGEFARREDVRFRLVGDARRAVYGAYGIERGGIGAFLAPGAAVRALRATVGGHLHGRFDGNELQLPGDFVIDAVGVVRFAHRGSHIGDNASVDTLLAAVDGART